MVMARASIILSIFSHLAGEEKNGEMMHEHSAGIYGARIIWINISLKRIRVENVFLIANPVNVKFWDVSIWFCKHSI